MTLIITSYGYGAEHLLMRTSSKMGLALLNILHLNYSTTLSSEFLIACSTIPDENLLKIEISLSDGESCFGHNLEALIVCQV